MDRDNPQEIYESDHVPDPVAVAAAREAVAATDPEYKHPWVTRVVIGIFLVLLLAGTFGAIIGAINTIQLGHSQAESAEQNKQLQIQQACVVKLIKQQQTDQAVRTKIAADDRAVLDALVARIFAAKSHEEVLRVRDEYIHERKINDKKRAKYGVKTIDLSTCTLQAAKTSSAAAPATPSATKTSPSPKAGSTTSAKKPAAGKTTHASKAGGAGQPATNPTTAPGQPKPSSGPSRPVTRPSSTTAAPKPTTTPQPTRTTAPKPTPTPTPRTTPPLINLPPIKICIPGLIC